MIDLTFIAPVILILAVIDVIVHIHLDIKKTKHYPSRTGRLEEPVPEGALFIAGIATVLSFVLVLVIPVDWYLTNAQAVQILLIIPDPPIVVTWMGFLFLVIGILLHCWSRWVRQELATSWKMGETHQLITSGPYGRIRHPSYASYMWSFIGFFLILPSIFTAPLFLGIPGYYLIARIEETHLIQHFGAVYEKYIERTGRFLPKIW